MRKGQKITFPTAVKRPHSGKKGGRVTTSSIRSLALTGKKEGKEEVDHRA